MKSVKAALFALLIAEGPAFAQSPECPCPAPPAPPPPVWFGKVDFSYLSTSGNTDTSSIGGGLELNFNPKPWLFTLKGAYLHAAIDGVTKAEAETFSLRATRDLTDRIDAFVGAGYLRNRFSGINNIYNFDAGAGYKLFKGPNQFLRVEGGIGYSSEQDIRDRIVVPFRNYANGRAAVNYKWQFSKTAAFTNDFTFLLDLDQTSNWFITEKAAITASLTSVFALQASWTLFFRNQPVPGFEKRDTATALGIVAKF